MRLLALFHPAPSLADVAAALLAELGRFGSSNRSGQLHVPNAWTVELSDRDARRRNRELPAWSAALADRLVVEHERHGLPVSGLVTVRFAPTAGVEPGSFRLRGSIAVGQPAVQRSPEVVPGRPRLTLAAGGTARHGTPAAAGIDTEVMLPFGTFVIGRGKDVDLRLQDPAVSPRHLTVEVTGDRVRLADCGSRNGTLIDGMPAVVSDLVDGNRIELGKTTLIFHREERGGDRGRQGGEPE